jgi:hypothetical protein
MLGLKLFLVPGFCSSEKGKAGISIACHAMVVRHCVVQPQLDVRELYHLVARMFCRDILQCQPLCCCNEVLVPLLVLDLVLQGQHHPVKLTVGLLRALELIEQALLD